MYEPTAHRNGHPSRSGGAFLDRSEAHFRRLLEKLPAGAYTCDALGLITYFNHHAVQIWGRAPKLNDPVDRFCGSFRLYQPDGTPLDHDQCWMALALREEREFNGCEIIIERPDGGQVTALAHANPIHDEAGTLLGAVNVLVDITERKEAEDALREADRSKNEFLATLAHELRNPLVPIRNAVEILHRIAAPEPDMQWALEVIGRQTQQMARLIDDVFDLGRIACNKLDLRKEQIELAPVLRMAVETSRPLMEAGGHQFVFEEPTALIYLDGDLTRLAQVVSNLLNNAARYTEPGGQITLGAAQHDGEVVITVHDTGVGIGAEALPHIFEMFAQETRSPDWSPGGLGIGLTLAQRIVDIHGGTITAESAGRERGSTFTVRLPAACTPAPAPPAACTEPAAAEAAASLRVLVVDDNPDIADSLVMLLEMSGYEVHTAHDGPAAIRAAEARRPDVVLLDIGLPGMNGYDAARAMRAQSWGEGLVLIAFTGWGQQADIERAFDAGFNHHVVKPVEPDALMHLLASLEPTVAAR